MSTLFAVSYINFLDNDLTTEFHRAPNWHTALSLHTKVYNDEEHMEYLSLMSQEDAQTKAFAGDWMFDVVEVPSV